MHPEQPNAQQPRRVAMISGVLTLLSMLFLLLSACSGFFILISFSGPPDSVTLESLMPGIALLIFSFIALYLIHRARRRVRGMNRDPQ